MHKPFVIHFIYTGIILICSALLALAAYHGGSFPIGFDYEYQFLTYEAFRQQLNEGELYPRWFKDINGGFGGANFFFYPPLYYYTQYLIDSLSAFNLSIPDLMSVTSTFILFLSGVSLYFYASRTTSRNISLIAALCYISLPYHFWFDLYERNGLSEFAAYIWMPLIFYCLTRFDRGLWYRLGYSTLFALLILTHIPSSVMVSIFTSLYVFWACCQKSSLSSCVSYGMKFSIFSLLGAGLSCFYLYPALTMLGYVNSGYLWSDLFHYSYWFLLPYNQDYAPLPYLRMTFFYVALSQLFISYAIFISAKEYFSEEDKKSIYPFLTFLTFSFVLTTPLSAIIWDNIILVQKLQLPYRFLLIFEFFFIATIIQIYATSFSKNSISKRMFALCLILHMLVMGQVVHHVTTASLQHLSQELVETRLPEKHLSPEHIPLNSNFVTSIKDIKYLHTYPFYKAVSGEAHINVIEHKPRKISLDIIAKSPTTIQIRQFHFAGWRINDLESSTDVTDAFKLRDALPHGQIEFDVPIGQNRIDIILVQMTEEKIGVAISLISAFILLLLIITAISRRKKTI